MLDTLLAFHIVGLALGLGAATTKTLLLLRAGTDPVLVAAYLQQHRPITRVIITGLVLLVLSGAGLLFVGFSFDDGLMVKIVLVVAIFVLGPLIDHVGEPRYARAAPAPGDTASSAFVEARRLYVGLELTATLLFYGITVFWLLR